MKRKILSVLLALCMVLGMAPGTARAAEVANGTCGDNLTWTLDDAGTLTISGTGEMEDYDSYSSPWDSNRSSITSVSMGNGVASIGDYAFQGCANLARVTIPSGVISIGAHAFDECGLTRVDIPDGVTTIGDRAFKDSGLIDISIPASVVSIGTNAFGATQWLTDQAEDFVVINGILIAYKGSNTVETIPESVASIGGQAFVHSNLTSVTIPDSVTSIGEWAFYSTGLTNVTIPESVTFIGENAFYDCTQLEKVYYPSNPDSWQTITIGTDALPTDATVYYYPDVSIYISKMNVGASVSFEVVIISDTAFKADVSAEDISVSGADDFMMSEISLEQNARSIDNKLTFTLEGPANGQEVQITVLSSAFGVPVATATEPDISFPSLSLQIPSPWESDDDADADVETETAEPEPEPEPPEPDPVPSPPAPSEPDQSSTLSRPVSIFVDDELETGGPGEITISGEGKSDMQHIVKPGEYVNWIDRVDLPKYATDLYTVLCIGGDHDTLYDILINDKYNTVSGSAAGTAAEEADVESVLELVSDLNLPYSSGEGLFQGDQFTGGFDTIDTTAGDRAIQYGDLKEGDVVRTSAYNGIFVTRIRKDGNDNFEADKKEAATYASTAFQAFDRDHPEVFWLSGKSKLRLVTVTMKDGGQTYKETYVFFVLADADGFTVRDPLYSSQAVIEAGIARRDAAVETILSTVTATTPDAQASQLNRWLTEHNHYNTSADLYSLPNWPHECLSALEGNIGTDGPVCDGYSRAFKVLCDRLEIPCVLVDGYAITKAGGSGEFHMWNSVQMSDGQWYGVDVTWNDPSVKGVDDAKSGHEREDFLLVGADTVVFGLKFSESHPPKNRAANGGVAFVNGPSLSAAAFNPLAGASVLPFTDVAADSWYLSAVEYVYEHDLMTGETGTTFVPGGAMTRAMVWTVLGRMDGADVNGGSPWYSGAQSWAVNAAVSDGSNPNGSISREELVTMLWRTQGSPAAAADLSGFTDSGTVSGWADGAVRWAVSTGLLEGSGGLLKPGGRATRAEVAAILMRFFEASGV